MINIETKYNYNDTTTKETIINCKERKNNYTLIWKDLDGLVCFKSFTEFEKLKIYVKEYIYKGLIKNLKSVDKEKTIYYLEVDYD